MNSTVLITDLAKHVGETVTLAGWLYNARVSSKVAFLMVRERNRWVSSPAGACDITEQGD